MKSNINDIKEVRKVNDHAVDIETKAPFPILPEQLSTTYMMSKKWCETNQATQPVDRRKGIENAASFRANGTGPYRLRERQPNVRTTFVRNGNYWGKIDGNVQEVVFTPIGNDATRVAALLSGEIDVMEPVPVQDIERINASPNAKVLAGPELRTIFLGMDQKRDELLFSSVKGKNPFKDKRVRQAFYQAIDIEGIKKTVMRGASNPDGADGRPRHQRLPARAEQAPALRPGSRQEAAGRRRLPERLRGHDELPERPLRQRRARSARRWRPTCRASASRSTWPPKPRAHTSRRSCAATPASTCWAGRPAPTTRTTR